MLVWQWELIASSLRAGMQLAAAALGVRRCLGDYRDRLRWLWLIQVDCEHALGCSVDGSSTTSNGKGDKVFPGPEQGSTAAKLQRLVKRMCELGAYDRMVVDPEADRTELRQLTKERRVRERMLGNALGSGG